MDRQSVYIREPPRGHHVRAVARSENPGGLVVLGGDNVSPLVEIGLTDLPKTGGALVPPAPPLATALLLFLVTLLMGQLLKCSNWDAKLDIYGCVLEHY